jgi:2-polyprenyl-3-methyl-5-hydroxy-6-metoxy-1,4-benzoquinol methylase
MYRYISTKTLDQLKGETGLSSTKNVSMIAERKKVAEHWSSQCVWQPDKETQWLQLPAVQCRIAAKISGDPTVDWMDYVIDKYYAGEIPVSRCLSVGCGEGDLERRLAARGFFLACDAYDIAQGSIARARDLAVGQGFNTINYDVRDINDLALQPAHYDAIFSFSALHHFVALEHVLSQIHTALKPGGLFIINEYIGPSRFQFPRQQVDAMNATLRLLPLPYRRIRDAADDMTSAPLSASSGARESFSRLRRGVTKIREGSLWPAVRRKAREELFRRLHTSDGGRFKLEVACPTVSDVVRLDPSEAVRSDEIIPLLHRQFEVVEMKGYGGSLLHFFLGGIAGNFTNDAAGQSLLDMLFQIEDSLIDAGQLDHDFALLVARARS